MTKTGPRECPLPLSLPPRGLNRVQAAAYIGVSPSLFDRMIADGVMPKPKRIWGRVVWDRLRIDEAFTAIPNDDDTPRKSIWDEVT